MKFSRFASAFLSGSVKGHFGQWGEDVIIRKIFNDKSFNGFYLDLGAYHPFTHSNTAYFWMKGWSGVNIDANPNTIDLFNKVRPNDKNIWAAIIPQFEYDNGVREVSLLIPDKFDSSSGISATGTVVESVAEGRGFAKKIKVPAKSVSTVILECGIENLDYLNIDIEGMDELILNELDLYKLSPRVISVEDYTNGGLALLNSNISRMMNELGYSLVGRAGPTSIFEK